jgi:sugar phosphate isomerase/epimerase
MKVGLDTFTIRELELDFKGQLDFIKDHGLAGAQLHDVPADLEEMKSIQAHAEKLDLFVFIAVTPCNPFFTGMNEADLVKKLSTDIKNAAACGWHEMRSIMGDHLTRYEHEKPWSAHVAATISVLKKLKPLLLECGSRLNIENHGDATTHDLVRLVEEVGEDVVGICLDTGNLLVLGEDPVSAVKRAAPYVHLTHAKDAILFKNENAICRQCRGPGGGIVDWPEILKTLYEHNRELPICIEDHKWLFDVPVHDKAWRAEQPDLSDEELQRFVRMATSCQKKIDSGELPDPDAYEAIPYLEQMEERVGSGRDYLYSVIESIEGTQAKVGERQ